MVHNILHKIRRLCNKNHTKNKGELECRQQFLLLLVFSAAMYFEIFQVIIIITIKLKHKKHYNVGTVPKYNRNIVKRCKIYICTPNIHEHGLYLSWFGTCASIAHLLSPPPLNQIVWSSKCSPYVSKISTSHIPGGTPWLAIKNALILKSINIYIYIYNHRKQSYVNISYIKRSRWSQSSFRCQIIYNFAG